MQCRLFVRLSEVNERWNVLRNSRRAMNYEMRKFVQRVDRLRKCGTVCRIRYGKENNNAIKNRNVDFDGVSE